MLDVMAAQFAGQLGRGLGDAIGGGGGPFVGGAATSAAYGTTLDGAGWVVNMGGTQIASASPTRTTTDTVPREPMQAGVSGIAALLLVGVAVVMILRKRKG